MKTDLTNKKVLITSGPTVEKMDPVRYISNFSSGKMGRALAKAFLNGGSSVCVVSGPVSIEYPSGAEVINITSACEMLDECEKLFFKADIIICAAAVSDYRPKKTYEEKLKKGMSDDVLKTIDLVENPDILKTLSSKKSKNQIVIGFSAETNNVIKNAKEKLIRKGCDFIIANDVSDNKVFGSTDTSASIISSDGSVETFKSGTKDELAQRIVDVCC